MKKQYGMISVGAMVGLGVLAVFGLTLLWAVTNYYGANNYRVDTEKVIVAQYTDMESILSSYSLKIADAAQVPAMYKDDFREVAEGVMKARQGEGGSKAVFQWFQEHQINIPAELYANLQNMIEAGRNKFENAQRKFIDQKRGYLATLEKNLLLQKGWWIDVTGGPRIRVGFPAGTPDDYAIISSEHAKETFDTKVDKGLKLR